MSLSELVLAPAVISSEVKKMGHDFEFFDTNLDLFERCQKNYDLYHEKVEILQDWKYQNNDKIIDKWLNEIFNKIKNFDVILINVFSHMSQSSAYKFCQLANKLKPNVTIIIGGIGSQKNLNNGVDVSTAKWIDKTFTQVPSLIFGELMLSNQLVDYWQKDVSTSVLSEALPKITNNDIDDGFDFSIYSISDYDWNDNRAIPMLGSYGCVRRCSFCDVVKHFPRYSFIEADNLTKQIVKAYNQTGIGKIQFMDSLVNGSMSNFEALLRNLAHSKQQNWLPDDFSWSGTYICRKASIPLDRIHDLLPLSGADNLVIGVESGSDKIRFEMQKKFTNDDLVYELSAFKDRNVSAQLLFFPAWPTETTTDFEETLHLFQRLGEFAQSNTIDSISLSAFGFTLIDGTPIDKQKEEIGLEPGPLPWLWHCRQNPELNFWESIRRRLLAIEVAQYYGITSTDETRMRRYLNTSLLLRDEEIKNYVGNTKFDIMNFSEKLSTLPNQHTIKFDIVNSGDKHVMIYIDAFGKKFLRKCDPGITHISTTAEKIFGKEQTFSMQIRFPDDYNECWNQYPNGDYYSTNGVYINNIFVDHRNVTMWGFNQMTEQQFLFKGKIPVDYYKFPVNKRCVPIDTNLIWNVPADQSLHQFIWHSLNPEVVEERKFVNNKLKRTLEKFS